MNSRKWLSGIGLVAALALTACGGGGNEGGLTTGGSGAAGGEGGATALNVEGNTALKFAPETITAKAGAPISVNFKNSASAGLQHNWVLVQPGKENDVATAAAGKGGDATGVEGVITTGKVLDGGASETINVPAQQAGSYQYICTVPGHYQSGMKGTLTVQ